jgi:hypothetical protein
MPSIMRDNWINVRPGDPALVLATNVCEWFELGTREGTDYWLEAEIVGDGEFLFNGRLFLPGVAGTGTIIDNFPKGPTPSGWTRRQRVDGQGYELISDNNVLFGYRVVPTPIPGRSVVSNLCFVAVNIYDSKRGLVAESLPDEFRLHRHPAKIGRGGIVFG